MSPPVQVRPETDDPEELIGRLAEWALEERSNHIDPDHRSSGTWLGAISMPLFEGLSLEDTITTAETVREETDAPEPTDFLIDEMVESYGVGAEWGGDTDGDIAEAAATLAAAVYGRLGLEVPDDNEADGRTQVTN